jgi:hypothetical protein
MLDAGGSTSAAEAEIRTTLREIAVLAAGADTEARWLHRQRGADRHRKIAALMARLFQDAAVLGRLLPASADDPARIVARAALEQAAGATAPPACPGALADVDPALAAPLQLLLDELRPLARLRAR